MKVIVGLGNPGKKYAQTKHNAGFMCLDYYANKNNESFSFQRKFNAETLKIGDALLVKPQTFMNLSGESVRSVLDYYDVSLEDLLIIYDDIALPMAKIRLRKQGSAGGHNGIKSIIQHLHTDSFQRLRIGIDQHPMMDAKDYVLGKFSASELDQMVEVAVSAKDIIDEFINGRDFDLIMNDYNKAQ